MNGLFSHAYVYNRPLSDWNTSNILIISHVFHSAMAFNQPLSTWNIRRVHTMSSMFEDASHFNQCLDMNGQSYPISY